MSNPSSSLFPVFPVFFLLPCSFGPVPVPSSLCVTVFTTLVDLLGVRTSCPGSPPGPNYNSQSRLWTPFSRSRFSTLFWPFTSRHLAPEKGLQILEVTGLLTPRGSLLTSPGPLNPPARPSVRGPADCAERLNKPQGINLGNPRKSKKS